MNLIISSKTIVTFQSAICTLVPNNSHYLNSVIKQESILWGNSITETIIFNEWMKYIHIHLNYNLLVRWALGQGDQFCQFENKYRKFEHNVFFWCCASKNIMFPALLNKSYQLSINQKMLILLSDRFNVTFYQVF